MANSLCLTTCCLLLFWSIVYVYPARVPRRKPKCEIKTAFVSRYVLAYQSHVSKGKGCSTNNTSPNKQAVHVVNLKVDQHSIDDTKKTKVFLKIEQLSSDNTDLNVYNDYGRPLVFILNSDRPVKWKVELSRIGQSLTNTKHLFIVPSHSSIRFKKTVVRVRSRKMSLQNLKNRTELINLAKRRFKALTTYSEVEGTSLIFRVGIETNVGSTCNINQLTDSHHILTSHKESQNITGCTTYGRRHPLSKPVYIIELQQAPQSDKAEAVVELDITSYNNEPLTKDFYLILKSPSNIRWKIRSRKMQGWIDIVTDAEAELKGIRMQTVASRREVMKATGDKLIQWAEKYIAAVESYTYITMANEIKLLLHSDKGVRVGDTSMPPQYDKNLDKTEAGDDIHDIIHTDCSQERFTVVFPNSLLREWGLIKEQITLLDRNCGATQNRTHVILESGLTDCSTKYLQIDDNYIFSNAIVIHSAGDTDTFLDDYGSGSYMDTSDMSGAGINDDINTNTYMDDEDFHTRKVEIVVKCEKPRLVLPPKKSDSIDNLSSENNYRLEIYTSQLYDEQINTTPIIVNTKKKLYIQASITSDIPLKVQVENCWLSPSFSPNSKNSIVTGEQLIVNGCAKDSSVEWHNMNLIPGRANFFKSLTPYSRFSFHLQDNFHGQNSFLYCELSQCQMHFVDNSIGIPQCPDTPRSHCDDQRNTGLIRPSPRAANHKILTLGPLTLNDLHIISSSGGIGPQYGTDGVTTETQEIPPQQSVIIEGLDSGTVVGIAFAAFAIGILLTGTLWFIHTHTGPSKHVLSSHGSTETTGEMSPNTQLPSSA